MQGKLIFAILSAALPSAVIASEPPRRQTCQRAEQPQQRPQQAQQQQRRTRPQGCPVIRSIPAVVDPTPFFLL